MIIPRTLSLLMAFLSGMLAAQPYLDPSLPVTERVEDLVSRMTLEEKIGQMVQGEHNILKSNDDLDMVTNHVMGSLLGGGGSGPANGNDPEDWADMYDSYQELALNTRLQIPLIFGIDAVHGHNNVYGATIFPHNIGLGCIDNPELIREIGRVTAREVSATGIDWTFAPCVATPRNERWGRTYEGFGETSAYSSEGGRNMIRGLQGTDLLDGETIVACAKHYVADGATLEGIDQGNAVLSEAELRAIHLPAYQAAVEEKVGTVMASFSSYNGVKMHEQKYLMTDVLKGELGFEGFIISDWDGISQINPTNYKDAVERAVNAGIDMAMEPYKYADFMQYLAELVSEGRVPLSRINDAVRRILRIKFQLGLFENPFTDRTLLSTVGSAAHRQVARQSVRESMVLLKNKNNLLPLSDNLEKVYLAGSKMNDLGSQCGGWTIQWQGVTGPDITIGTTVQEALKNRLSGTDLILSQSAFGNRNGAEVAILVIGEAPYAEGAGDKMANQLVLSANDRSTLERLRAMEIPIVTILFSGRPLVVTEAIALSDAFIAAWLPGTEGEGITDVLFGDYPFTGKLSHSWPRSASQIPINQGNENYDPLYALGTDVTDLDPADVPDEELLTIITGERKRDFEIVADPRGARIIWNKQNQVPLSYTLTSVNGQVLQSGSLSESQTVIDMSLFERGLFLLRVDDGQSAQVLRFLR